MRILQIHNTYLQPGGEDLVVSRERELLRKQGHEVNEVRFDNPDRLNAQIRTFIQASWNVRSSKRLDAALEAEHPDVTHVHNTWYAASPSVVAGAHRRSPVVATLHNYRRHCLNAFLYRNDSPCMDCVGHIPWRGVVRRCYHDSTMKSLGIGVANTSNRAFGQLDRFIDRFLVLSDFAAELCRQSGLDDAAVVRHDNFVPDPGPRLNPVTDSQTIIAVGRLSPEKGFAELIEAWNQAGPKDLHLQIVGNGPERTRLEELAGSAVEVVGPRSSVEVAQLMRSSRALMFPSKWFEGQPLVILEALAAGLPVFASDHPPLREIVDGASQLVVERDDWTTALDVLADDRWLEQASLSARGRFEERYTETVALERLLSIYRSVER